MGFGSRCEGSGVTVPWAPRTSGVQYPMGPILRRVLVWVYGGDVCLCDPMTIRLTD